MPINDPPYVTIRTRSGMRTGDPMASGSGDIQHRSATHDISRASFHVKHIDQFARRLEDSASRAFPNRNNASQRYKKVQALLLHWGSDDLFVLPELEDLEKCLREDYSFGTDIFAIPSENSHLELMMKIGQLIKEHESPDTLFLIYYGGHARIDESRQSTWCATRDTDSAWLQWSAIQTLLERSKSDVLILLDCCAGAASATFPTGNSITETISASSWDAIAPDPGRYSFTNALIEVLQEWRMRTFSAAMLHAEVLARLKHPRPININGKHFEARSTPVHFMMTANHKAPSIEICRAMSTEKAYPSARDSLSVDALEAASAADAVDVASNGFMSKEPNEDTPHVMISLALEDDQSLDINAWQQWLSAVPSMAKYVKVQGVFKSHSTLLLVSMPVMIWDMLPEDPATSFVAFIRSNNLATQQRSTPSARVAVPAPDPQQEATGPDSASLVSGVSGTTFAPTENTSQLGSSAYPSYRAGTRNLNAMRGKPPGAQPFTNYPLQHSPLSASPPSAMPNTVGRDSSATSSGVLQRQATSSSISSDPLSRQIILNQQQSQRRTTFGDDVPEPKKFSAHIESRLEEYYQNEPLPTDAQRAFFSSNLGIETLQLEAWFHHRRERDVVSNRLATMKIHEVSIETGNGPHMILPADLNRLLEISMPGQTLLLDLRSPEDYYRSHIYRAINFRVPRSFMQAASLDMIERALPDEESRTIFATWPNTRCLVLYSKGMEFPWECPAAELLLDRLRETGWAGSCFILKGHYREFSDSFDKYAVGAKMTPEAQAWAASQQSSAAREKDISPSQEVYTAWLSHVETEDRFRPTAISPVRAAERMAALEQLERELEAEFQAKNRDLFHKALELNEESMKKTSNLDVQARMVEYVDRGLSKMRNPQPTGSGSTMAYEPGYTKVPLDSAGYFDRSYMDRDVADEYVEISRRGEETPGGSRSRSKTPGDSRTPTEEMGRRGRGGNFINKVFRR
ncbi:tyrosine-protein phosphatase non-receptor type 6 [Stachybotrys elegans]|uniref:Tyrosine-protein phosphatase non-receptor type 6 n=1 Tax=Stachybotrys elegans TaxID=80388 RepID=A0A8K0SII5_9HYPO|nr:tyrosine-protein phosphatase non-receptor type 6 [Stachybotrys elegans]